MGKNYLNYRENYRILKIKKRPLAKKLSTIGLLTLISRPFKKTVDSVKEKIMSIFKRNAKLWFTIKYYSKPTRTKNVYGAGKKSRKLKITKII